jgi:DNA polymerase III alpha subunit
MMGLPHTRMLREPPRPPPVGLRVPDLVRAVAAAPKPAVAVTDQGNLFGMVKFYRAAVQAGLKPIVCLW